VNFLALLAYPPKEDGREVMSFDEFVADFDWAKVNPVGPIFDLDKLGWLNGHYIRALDTDELADRIVGHLTLTGVLDAEPKPAQVELIRAATPLVQERMQLLSEAEGMLYFLLVSDADLVVADDARAQLKGDPKGVLDVAIPALEALPEWVSADIEAALRAALVEGLGIKPKFAFTPLRVGVTGRRISPPLFESMQILGRESSLVRLRSLRATL
jgi:glutamyl-tRNA synthetase